MFIINMENMRKSPENKTDETKWLMNVDNHVPALKKLHMISHPFFAMFAHLKAIRWRRRSTVSTGFFNCFRLVNSTGQ